MIGKTAVVLTTTKTKNEKVSITTKNSMMFQLTESVLSSDFQTYMMLKELLQENIKELKQEVVHIQYINNCLENNINSIYQLKKSIYKMDVSVLQKYYELRSSNLIKWQERLFQQYTLKQWW
ncbi:Hypothetical_protein [Hexamita inflata]|uniref:Hypothetical_protein n=1 Tax=Hexamita inflata TaxID=28002 RepID=A0AA86R0S9_9EUKA|nr:Hypothetical protein HINF_LOCUS52421 [Hexamita inflata]